MGTVFLDPPTSALASSRHPMAGENPDYLEFVSTLKCRMSMQDPCSAEQNSNPHRTGVSDETAVPLCGKHRLALVTLRDPFVRMGAKGRAEWERAQVRFVQGKWHNLS